MTLAEFGVNLDWTNAQGMNIVQYIKANPTLMRETLSYRRRDVLPQWISILEEAMQSQRGRKLKGERKIKNTNYLAFALMLQAPPSTPVTLLGE